MADVSGSGRIFISYRRVDSGGHALLLRKELSKLLPAVEFFLDVASISAGEDFVEAISAELAGCDLVIAVIGPRWLDARDAAGARRLDHPGDYVRIELETALERGVRIVPALVQGAKMPPPSALPDSLARLARRNALELSGSSEPRWDSDVHRLAVVIAKAVGTEPPALIRNEAVRRRFGTPEGASQLQSAAPHAAVDVPAGPWHVVTAERRLVLLKTAGSYVHTTGFRPREKPLYRWSIRSSADGLALADDRTTALLLTKEHLILAWLTPEGRLVDAKARFDAPMANCRLLAARAAGRAVYALLSDSARNLCLRLSAGGDATEYQFGDRAIRAAAATDEDFATIDAVGRLSRWPDPRATLESESDVTWVSIDSARGRDVVLTAAIGRYEGLRVLYATRTDGDSSQLRTMALNEPGKRVAVARAAGGYGEPSEVVVETDQHLCAWSWGELPRS